MDKHSHWDVNTVENFLDKVTDENLLSRFFTDDEFALKATELGIDLSEAPKRKGTKATQEAYEKLSQQLRLTYEEPYLQEYINGDPDVRQSINGDIYSYPEQYGMGNYTHSTVMEAVQRLRDEGLHTPSRELVDAVQQMEPELTPEVMGAAYDNLLQIIPERWSNAFVNSLNDTPTSRRALHDDILARPAEYEIDQFPENIRQIIANSILHLGMNRPPNAHFR